jgi:hypothetical protein
LEVTNLATEASDSAKEVTILATDGSDLAWELATQATEPTIPTLAVPTLHELTMCTRIRAWLPARNLPSAGG